MKRSRIQIFTAYGIFAVIIATALLIGAYFGAFASKPALTQAGTTQEWDQIMTAARAALENAITEDEKDEHARALYKALSDHSDGKSTGLGSSMTITKGGRDVCEFYMQGNPLRVQVDVESGETQLVREKTESN